MYNDNFENSHDLLMNSSIGIHFVDKDGFIVYANQCELETLGYTHDEYVGHHVKEFQLDHDVLDDIMQRLMNKEPLSNYPTRVQGKHGILYILYQSNVYWDGDQFVHTRCFGSAIEEEAYEIFKRYTDYKTK